MYVLELLVWPVMYNILADYNILLTTQKVGLIVSTTLTSIIGIEVMKSIITCFPLLLNYKFKDANY